MKMSDVRALELEAVEAKLAELRKNLFELRLKNSLRQLDNTAQIRTLRHEIAQLETARREKLAPQEVLSHA